MIDNRLQLCDVNLQLKQQMEKRNSDWYQSYSEDKGKVFYSIQPAFSEEPWYMGNTFKGNEVRLINRLMTGHDFSKFWLAKMKIADDPDCEICAEPETSEHIIMDCPRYGVSRSKFSYETKFATLNDLFKSRDQSYYKEIVEFVKATKTDF